MSKGRFTVEEMYWDIINKFPSDSIEKRLCNQIFNGGLIYIVDETIQKEMSLGKKSIRTSWIEDSINLKLPFIRQSICVVNYSQLLQKKEVINENDVIYHHFKLSSKEAKFIRNLNSVVIHPDESAAIFGVADLSAARGKFFTSFKNIQNVLKSSKQDFLTSFKNIQNVLKNSKQEFKVAGISAKSKPALFLDRDGVLIEHVDYPNDPQSVKKIEEIVPFIQNYQKRGFYLVVITNQSGIGRGYYNLSDYKRVNEEMKYQFRSDDIHFDLILHSDYYHSTTQFAHYQLPQMRKPAPGMIFQSLNHFDIDIDNSVMIGNRASDLFAGFWAGIKSLYLYNKLSSGELTLLKKAKNEICLSFKLIDKGGISDLILDQNH